MVSVVNTVADTSRPAGERAIAGEHLLAGRPHLVERLCGLEFVVSANSFFQTSSAQAERLYQLVAEAAGGLGFGFGGRGWDLGVSCLCEWLRELGGWWCEQGQRVQWWLLGL